MDGILANRVVRSLLVGESPKAASPFSSNDM